MTWMRWPSVSRRGLVAALVAVSALVLLQVGQARADDSQLPPDQLIAKISNDMLATIKTDKDLQTGSLKKLNEVVDAKVMPFVNFQRMTSAAVARGWRQASPQQQQQLMTEFRTLLVRTYAGALSQVKDQTVQMKPTRGDLSKDTEVQVRSQIVQPGRDPIPLEYRMEKSEAGAWKIYDVNVMGAWLVETYRNQFGPELNSGGVDGLIKTLVDKNKAAAAAK